MKIKVETPPAQTLGFAEFGSVVRTEISGPTLYLVASPMDGTGTTCVGDTGWWNYQTHVQSRPSGVSS